MSYKSSRSYNVLDAQSKIFIDEIANKLEKMAFSDKTSPADIPEMEKLVKIWVSYGLDEPKNIVYLIKTTIEKNELDKLADLIVKKQAKEQYNLTFTKESICEKLLDDGYIKKIEKSAKCIKDKKMTLPPEYHILKPVKEIYAKLMEYELNDPKEFIKKNLFSRKGLKIKQDSFRKLD